MTTRSQLHTAVMSAWVDEYGPLPDSYVCVDLESTGITPKDKIVQIGWCLVKERKTVLSQSVILDWTRDAATDQKWLADTLERTRTKMVEKGKQYPWTLELMRDRGKTPQAATELFVNACKPYDAYSTHYGWAFDYPRIGQLLDAYGFEFAPHQSRMIDTGLLTKACLTNTVPKRGESVAAYMRRIDAIRSSPRHNIEACMDLYGLDVAGAHKRNAHDGGYDAWLVALMTEKVRHLEHTNRNAACPQ